MAPPQAGWLRGVVKECPSADTLVIMGAVKSGIPPEKRLTLSSVIAPKLVSARAARDRGQLGAPHVGRGGAARQLGGREGAAIDGAGWREGGHPQGWRWGRRR